MNLDPPTSDLPHDNLRPFPGPPRALPAAPQNKALFRTLRKSPQNWGIRKSTLRAYCCASGIHSSLGKRIMLHKDDIPKLVEWIREDQAKADDWWTEPEPDPFA